MEKEDIVGQYKNTPLGKDNLNRDIFVDEIVGEGNLKDFLYNMYGPGDVSLTKKGLEFLEEYYGLDEVAGMVLAEKEKGVDYLFKSREEVVEWLSKFRLF